MPDGSPAPGRRRLPLRVAIGVSVVALLLLIGGTIALLLGPRSDDQPPATLVSGPPEQSHTGVPAEEVDTVHAALHGLGDTCARGEETPLATAVRRDVTVILDFARRHPDAGFVIDDESGSSLSLLLVLQDELRTCAPDMLPQVRVLLPPELRRQPTPNS